MTVAATVTTFLDEPAAAEAVSTPALLTVRPAPRREPPFDDELPIRVSPATLFDQPLPFPRTVPGGADVRAQFDPDLPDPSGWARRLLIGLAEAAAGKRPLHQMADLLTPSIVQGVAGELRRAQDEGRPHWLRGATVRSIRTMQPRAGVAEITATLSAGTRVRAVAVRIERRHGRWRCTRIMLG